ncbi:MAG TPA: hypothetical protein VHU87_13110 [Rhizomicrobium sp.]|jgi:deoxycytidine triphosphate deaminase|nr:hypothetical protein [Rhizomicrobium sp.]
MTDTAIPAERPFAENEEEARERAQQRYSVDPFAEIKPSLLSSADISRYVNETGMLFPFDKTKLKSASYEVRPGGKFIYWQKKDGKTCKVEKTITKSTSSLVLPANSISYIQAEPYFRLPLYIAVRFNLRIKHVHRGILLGTGPIVDPGFSGQLLIPIHNLTSTDYEINLNPADEDDGLIWIEFTKTTFDASRDNLAKFDQNKKDKSPNYYLHEANGGNPILSSIHDGIEDAKAQAQSAAKSATSLRNLGIVAIVAVLVGISALVLSGYNIASGSLSLSTSVRQNMLPLATSEQRHEQDLVSLRQALDEETAKNVALVASLNALEHHIQAVELKQRIRPRGHRH